MTDASSHKNRNRVKAGYIPLLVGAVAVVAAFFENQRTHCDQDLTGDPGARTIYTEDSKNTQIRWLTDDHTAFECVFSQEEFGYRCGLGIPLDSETQKGVDLRSSSSIFLKLQYSGPSNYFRVSFQDAYQNPQIAPGGKYHQVILRLENDVNELILPLEDFNVPDWWSDQNPHLKEQQLTPSWSNVIHIGFDIQTPMPPGKHTFKVQKLCALQPQGANPTLVTLLALASVAFLAAIFLFFRHYQLNKERTRSRADIENLLRCFDKLRTQEDTIQEKDVFDPVTNLYSRDASIKAMNDYTFQSPIAGMFLSIIETLSYRKTDDHTEEVTSPETRTAVSIAVKMHIDNNNVAISWRKNRILILFPKGNAGKAKKTIKKIQTSITRSQLAGMPQNIEVKWQLTQIRQAETFKQACDRLEEEL